MALLEPHNGFCLKRFLSAAEYGPDNGEKITAMSRSCVGTKWLLSPVWSRAIGIHVDQMPIEDQGQKVIKIVLKNKLGTATSALSRLSEHRSAVLERQILKCWGFLSRTLGKKLCATSRVFSQLCQALLVWQDSACIGIPCSVLFSP